MKDFLKKHYLELLFLGVIILPFVISALDIYNKTMPFWFDPARDFLAAISNQHKLTLIGQPTGIPGLFYGPYWIWLLSLALFVSRDPRVVQFLVLCLPYYTIFPLVLYKFRKIFGLKVSIGLWILFIFSFMRYTIFPWNPHLAPLLVLCAFYFLTLAGGKERHQYLRIFIAGILVGLIGNFQISFDIGFSFAILLYLIIISLRKLERDSVKNLVINILSFGFGFILAFIPFLTFESRHGFFQVKVVIQTLTSHYAVVGIKGLTQGEIIRHFPQVFSDLFQAPWIFGASILIATIILLVFLLIKSKFDFDKSENKVLLLSFLSMLSIFAVYITSKNPVWDYHFIGIEIIAMLMVGAVVKEFKYLQFLILGWAILIALIALNNFFLRPQPSVLSYDTLGKKEYIVNLVSEDSKGEDYKVFAYNPGIYSYEYSYLFMWMEKKYVPFDPGQIPAGGNLVYLVIQKTSNSIFSDYVNYHTPISKYKTTKEWDIPDGTKVLRRELKT